MLNAAKRTAEGLLGASPARKQPKSAEEEQQRRLGHKRGGGRQRVPSNHNAHDLGGEEGTPVEQIPPTEPGYKF